MTVLKLFGVKLIIHWSWFLLLAIFYFAQGSAGLVNLVCLFAVVVCHEYGHVFAAARLGFETDRITLMIFGGVASIVMPRRMSPWEEIVITAAGPAVNVVFASVGFLAVLFSGWRNSSEELQYAVWYFTSINVVLFVFNIAPAFPMDGGRLLRAGLEVYGMGHSKATEVAFEFTLMSAVAFVAFGAWCGNLLLILMTPLLVFAALFEKRMAVRCERSDFMRKYLVGLRDQNIAASMAAGLQMGLPVENLTRIFLLKTQPEPLDQQLAKLGISLTIPQALDFIKRTEMWCACWGNAELIRLADFLEDNRTREEMVCFVENIQDERLRNMMLKVVADAFGPR